MEFLDIVDENDNVLGSASKAEIYQNKSTHRIVHIFITNKDKIILQMQSKHKKFCPLHWCTSAAGHVQAGETWEEAARRELMEEIGVDVPLEFSGKYVYVKESTSIKKILGCFKAEYNGSFKPNEFEVDKVESFTIQEIQSMIDSGEKFHPELLFLLNKHLKISL